MIADHIALDLLLAFACPFLWLAVVGLAAFSVLEIAFSWEI
jgi:hypothetical protein